MHIEEGHSYGHYHHNDNDGTAVTQLYRSSLPNAEFFEELKDFQEIFARYEAQILNKVRTFRWPSSGADIIIPSN